MPKQTGAFGGYGSPVQIGALTDWSNTQAGYNSPIVTKTDGTMWTWGATSGLHMYLEIKVDTAWVCVKNTKDLPILMHSRSQIFDLFTQGWTMRCRGIPKDISLDLVEYIQNNTIAYRYIYISEVKQIATQLLLEISTEEIRQSIVDIQEILAEIKDPDTHTYRIIFWG
jgi:hypothetical protein